MAWDQGLDEDFVSIAAYEGKYASVIAGAGTGKSFALKRKVARLLERGEPPDCILAVTFTRTAARDLKQDLQSLGVQGCDLVRACTLHSLCYSMLSRHEVFRVMQRQTRMLLWFEEDYLLADLSVRLQRGIRTLREQLHAFTSAWARLLHEQPGWPHNEEDRQFDHEMNSWLRFHRAMLVGELVPLTTQYLRNNPTSPERSLYKHILVDEYQDLNRAEQELIKLLCEYELPENRTLTVAGDDDQAIFITLKYAHPEGILNFKDEYPGTSERTLVICQRCPRVVIDLANAFLISTYRKECPKLLQPAPEAGDGEVAILQWRTLNGEADGIARIIAHKVSAGEVEPKDILVLTPRKEVGYAIVNSLVARGVQAETCFPEVMLDKKQAQEGYAYLSLLQNRDDAVSLRVLLGIDVGNRRARPYERIRQHCFRSGDTVVETLSKLQSGELNIPWTDALVERYQIVTRRLEDLSNLTLAEVIDRLFPEGVDDVAELRKLALAALEQTEEIRQFHDILNTAITQPELPEPSDSVRILTLYKAKGLTAKMVVIVNCLEGCIPYIGTYASEREEQEALAEQERLFFVALTRTTNTLIVSSTGIMRKGNASRMKAMASTRPFWPETSPSRFIQMLGPNAPTPQLGDQYMRLLHRDR